LSLVSHLAFNALIMGGLYTHSQLLPWFASLWLSSLSMVPFRYFVAVISLGHSVVSVRLADNIFNIPPGLLPFPIVLVSLIADLVTCWRVPPNTSDLERRNFANASAVLITFASLLQCYRYLPLPSAIALLLAFPLLWCEVTLAKSVVFSVLVVVLGGVFVSQSLALGVGLGKQQSEH